MAISDLLNVREFASDFLGGLISSFLVFQEGDFMDKVKISAIYGASHLIYDTFGSYVVDMFAGLTTSAFGKLFALFLEASLTGIIFYFFIKWAVGAMSYKRVLLYILVSIPIGDRLSVALGGTPGTM